LPLVADRGPSDELLESELFGAEAGAYTGATRLRIGRFEAAAGGTLFLDEIGNLSAAGQAKLLRVLQSGEFERLGSSQTRRADVRVLCATNTDLQQAIARGEFRQDLYFRIAVVETRSRRCESGARTYPAGRAVPAWERPAGRGPAAPRFHDRPNARAAESGAAPSTWGRGDDRGPRPGAERGCLPPPRARTTRLSTARIETAPRTRAAASRAPSPGLSWQAFPEDGEAGIVMERRPR
jgi:hypothetical protein